MGFEPKEFYRKMKKFLFSHSLAEYHFPENQRPEFQL